MDRPFSMNRVHIPPLCQLFFKQVTATDGDKDRPQNIVYFLTGQGIDPDNPANSKFDINRTSGEIYVLKVDQRDSSCLPPSIIPSACNSIPVSNNEKKLFIFTAAGQGSTEREAAVAIHGVRSGRGWGGFGRVRRRAGEPERYQRQRAHVPPRNLLRQRDGERNSG